MIPSDPPSAALIARPIVLKVTREFNAPAEAVFDAWLDPQTAGQWLFATPNGERVKVEIDPRVGGGFTIVEKRGELLAQHFGQYVALERPNRLVFLFNTDKSDNPSRVNIEIITTADGCKLTLTHEMESKWADWVDKVKGGWTKLLRGLDITISAELEIVTKRIFDAPCERVFNAWTTPEQVARWWGPHGFTNTINQIDVRVGGAWNFIMHGPDGQDYHNKIIYLEIIPPSMLVLSHVSGPVFKMTVTFDDLNGKTLLTMRMRFESTRERDRTAEEFGAIEGAEQTMARLEDLLQDRQ